MIDSLKSLCALMCQKKLTAKTVANELGTKLYDQGKNMPIVVQVDSNGIRAAKVVRKHGKKDPSHIEISLDDSSELRIGVLSEAFGQYQKVRKPVPSPQTQVMFARVATSSSHTCSLIAEAEPGAEDLDDCRVVGLILRRDIRLS